MRLNIRWLLIASAGVVPAFVVGYWLSGLASPEPPLDAPADAAVDASTESPSSEDLTNQPPEPVVFPDIDSGPRPPGEWQWSDLQGGECVDGFEGAFDPEFVVVGCDASYDAQFVRATVIDSGKGANYPGDEAIREAAGEHCVDIDPAGLGSLHTYDDLLVAPGYSLGEPAWERGDRLMGCFIYRESGQPFTAAASGQ